MFKGKAASLKHLQSLGLKVPEWKVLKHTEIVSWGNPLLWKEFCSSLQPHNSADLASKLERFCGSIKVPEDLLTSYKGKGPFAVRSSASLEDSVENSFAGIFETKLLVRDELSQVIIDVWASLYSFKALKYCDDRSLPYQQLAMDVIVQKMIIGEKSGVLFQADPMGLITQQVIVAGWGLGQGIVDDITDTDRYVIEGPEITSSNIALKKTYLSYDDISNNLVEKQVPEAMVQISVLNEPDIDKLLGASEKISSYNDYYMDVEFTFSGPDLYVLQARPITTLPGKKTLLVFDNSNIAENYPHQSTPLTFSGLKRGYAANFKNLIAYLGFPEHERKLLENNLNQLVGYWGGQIYYNLNNWYSVYGLLPFGGEKAIKSFNDMVGIKTSSPVNFPKRGFRKNLQLLLTVLPKFVSYYFRTSHHHHSYKLGFKTLYGRVKHEANEVKSSLEIINLLEEFDSSYLDLIKIPLFNDFFSSLLNFSSRRLAIKMAGADGERIYNDLLSHREDLESSKAIYSLIDLSQKLGKSPELLQFLEDHKDDPEIMKQLRERDIAFHQKLFQHFDRFGDRSQWEMKVEVPTARENPQTTIKLLLSYARSGLSEVEQRKREREKAERAQAEINSYRFRHPLKGILFRVLFKKCSQALCFREDARFDRVRYKGLSRLLLLKLGEVLLRKGLVLQKEDLFYLNWEEIIALKHDSFGPGYLKDLIDLRKRHLDKLAHLTLPDRIIVNDLSQVEKFNQGGSTPDTTHIFGIPCSGGMIEAECVVVHDLNHAPDLTGKILIAHRTDPAWGYFFVGVKGIIIEKGSMLSHAAIISRELGIPCIINVAKATSIFKTGMKLQMNGDNGEIRVKP